MELTFDREIIILNGVPTMGTVTVDMDAEKNDDGTWSIDLEVVCFEPETPLDLPAGDSEWPACNAWLLQNEARVQRRFDKAFKHHED